MAVNCREFLALLDAQGADLTPEALAHAESCPACTRAAERTHRARRELRALGDEQPPAFLAQRVMARVRAERRDALQPARLPWRLRPALAAAAAVVVALAGYMSWTALRNAGTPVQEARSNAVLADKRDFAAAAPAAVPERAAAPAAAPTFSPAVPPAAPLRPAHRERSVRSAGEKAAPAPKAAAARARSGDETFAVEADAPAPTAAPGAVGGIAFTAALEEGAVATQVGGESARAAVAEPALAKLEAAGEHRPALVELVLVGQQNGSQVALRAPAAAAPGGGQRWHVRVAPDGTISLFDATGRDIGATHAGAVAAVRAAGPAPGRYVLTRKQ